MDPDGRSRGPGVGPLLALLLVLAVLVVVASLAAPTARAQREVAATRISVSMADDVGQLPIVPPGATRTFDLTVVYAWDAGGVGLDRTLITFEATRSPGWADVEFVPNDYVYVEPPGVCPPPGTCPPPGVPGEVAFVQRVNVTVSEDAPYLDPDWFTIEATAHPNTGRGNLAGDDDATDDTRQLAAGALPQVSVSAAEALVQLRGGETRTIPVDLQNTGNVEVVTALSARDLPDGIEVSLPSQAEVNIGGTTTVNMTVRATEPFSALRAGFGIDAVPRHKQDPAVRGPRAATGVTVDVTPLPEAVLLGQMTMGEVFLITGGLVALFFVVGWPMTVWWETRRRDRRRRERAGLGDRSGQARPVGPAAAAAHGVPVEGDDYVVVDERAFADHFRRAG